MPINAYVSDLHGNFEAFTAVVKDMRDMGVDAKDVYCLGDIVNYGADSRRLVEYIMQYGVKSVRGNHDDGVATGNTPGWNPPAMLSAGITQQQLTQEQLEFLADLPTSMVIDGDTRLVHGCPPESFNMYTFRIGLSGYPTMGELETTSTENLNFVGHSHFTEWRGAAGNSFNHMHFNVMTDYTLDPQSFQISNVGSVGQPRAESDTSGVPFGMTPAQKLDAKYALHDTRTNRFQIRSVPYDVATAQQKIRDAGYPDMNADRLAIGD